MLTRRAALGTLIGTIAAPAVIRTPGLLMPIKVVANHEPYIPELIIRRNATFDLMWHLGLGRKEVECLPTKQLMEAQQLMYDLMRKGSAGKIEPPQEVAGYFWRPDEIDLPKIDVDRFQFV